ncbi:unnamed protein product [Ceratitis capitata]|uniref:(Mediterranean fruit fly) hypothetical protein n=1 Tax=Ceratitis capitata TaxID=7213 RepID=A0A811UGH9_CERCA|nr:unnamed protein product [Ceratitis capitata]
MTIACEQVLQYCIRISRTSVAPNTITVSSATLLTLVNEKVGVHRFPQTSSSTAGVSVSTSLLLNKSTASASTRTWRTYPQTFTKALRTTTRRSVPPPSKCAAATTAAAVTAAANNTAATMAWTEHTEAFATFTIKQLKNMPLVIGYENTHNESMAYHIKLFYQNGRGVELSKKTVNC